MKRKLALLLAAVMTLSMLPMNVFAATDNRLSNYPTVLPAKTVIAETGGRTVINHDLPKDHNPDVTYIVEGSDLIITLKNSIKVGAQFTLKLDNAVWFFRGTNTSPAALGTLAANNPTVNSYLTAADRWDTARQKWGTGEYGAHPVDNAADTNTYNTTNGAYVIRTGEGSETANVRGTYFRFANHPVDDPNEIEIPYSLKVSSATDSEAIITILNDGAVGVAGTYQPTPAATPTVIRVPLVTRTTAESDVKVSIIEGNTTSVSTGTLMFAMAGGSATNAYVNDPVTARQIIPIDRLIVKETRLSSMKTGMGSITAPRGFEFTMGCDSNGIIDPAHAPKVKVGVESGLSWTGGGTGFGTFGADYILGYKVNSQGDIDRSVIEFGINVNKSNSMPGTLYFEGLELTGDDSAPWGDVMLTIRSITSSRLGGGAVVSVNGAGISTQTFKAGTNMDWTISLVTEGTVPELVNGRYEDYEMVTAADDFHKTARVVFSENTRSAWWAGRQTVFSLPQGVKFRKVEVIDAINVDSSYADLKGEGPIYTNTGKKQGHVTINGNTMTWNNLKVKINSSTNELEKAKIRMDMWVSIEAGFKGDVVLSVTGSAIPVQTSENSGVPTVTIAKQISPVTVTSKVTDIKIGYQYQTTADILITETKAGNLLKNKGVAIWLSDGISSDMSFGPDTKVAVTEGDLKIKAIDVAGGAITYIIDVASSKASTVTVSNVAVKIDRTVPETNKYPYKAVVGGEAIAANYIRGAWLDGGSTVGFLGADSALSKTNKDLFKTDGIAVDYAKVISAANDKTNVLTQEVRVTIGESFYTVNGVPYEMPVAAYISTASNSTMVPVRFVANAFGIRDDQIVWDDSNKTVTIILPQRVVQFTIGKDIMKLNGTDVVLRSPDGKAVAAEITDERTFVPFRALGDAFGIPVDWDEATSTAIYNKGANVDTTVPAEAPAETPAA